MANFLSAAPAGRADGLILRHHIPKSGIGETSPGEFPAPPEQLCAICRQENIFLL
jgi:hypothetical protein